MLSRQQVLDNIPKVIEALADNSRVSGTTHSFYRYPARFSPLFVEAAINAFTDPGDVVYDPFMGGGTTLVESMRLGRKGVGTDVNSLSVFISQVKTTIYSDRDIDAIRRWVQRAQSVLKLNQEPERAYDWIAQGYQRNISSRATWPIRKTLEIALNDIQALQSKKQRDFIRCLLLNTTQWALDCRKHPPSAQAFRKQLVVHAEDMINGALSLRKEFSAGDCLSPVCLHLSACDIGNSDIYNSIARPKLILTSPPYPGVHVLYHRWQVNGRKETPAPYWIANCLDGNGTAYYTFGERTQKTLQNYFDKMRLCYKALSTVADGNTLLVQLVAFSSPEWQLPLFLDVLRECGFSEVLLDDHPSVSDGRSWRTVPNRKFYADRKGHTPSSKEVLLVHQLA